MCFSLASFYLGSPYKGLDLYLSKTEILAGRYRILTYVNVFFVQMCLWERFSACAPTPNPYPSLATFSSRIIIELGHDIIKNQKEIFLKC